MQFFGSVNTYAPSSSKNYLQHTGMKKNKIFFCFAAGSILFHTIMCLSPVSFNLNGRSIGKNKNPIINMVLCVICSLAVHGSLLSFFAMLLPSTEPKPLGQIHFIQFELDLFLLSSTRIPYGWIYATLVHMLPIGLENNTPSGAIYAPPKNFLPPFQHCNCPEG